MEREPVEVEIRRDFSPSAAGAALLSEAEKKLIQQEKEAILQEARQQGEAILEEARRKRASYVEEARREGMEIGYRQGMEEARRKARILEDEARSTLEEARRVYRELLEEAEPRLTNSPCCWRKDLAKQVSLAPKLFLIWPGRCWRRPGQGDLFDYAHPQDVEFLKMPGRSCETVFRKGRFADGGR